jgi:hypothetical protein
MMEVKHDPQSSPDHKDNQYAGEHQSGEVLERRRAEPDVKKEPEMHQDLEDRGHCYDDQGCGSRQSAGGDERERDGGQ